MKISLNWLKKYIDITIDADELSRVLTDIGLEVEGVEVFESIKGGLQGVVVGKVLQCGKHPNADKLHITTVDVGNNTVLPIVCGAPNVATNQTVLVATVGTTLYSKNQEFVIKKAKIRGEESSGMICAEDEIGLGDNHDGIMVLSDTYVAGTPASEIFEVENDVVFEIGLTPNRIDAASHIGVARDLAAFFSLKTPQKITMPDVQSFVAAKQNHSLQVTVTNADLCPRYAGVVISGLTVKESPTWLKNRLKAIGQKPINNVVDVTNFILHEMAQPLHAFDYDKIAGNKIIVGPCAKNTKFTTLDGVERTLSEHDIMISNATEPMCIGGVLGGLHSGITENTTTIFLESAYFNPVAIRKTAKAHGISTDASFRFERGIDPNITLYALKRAALLMQEVAGGTVASQLYDTNPNPVPPKRISLSVAKIHALIGKEISKETICSILSALDIYIDVNKDDTLEVLVPPYRVDVDRQEDIVEEILRMYGFNNIQIPTSIRSSISYSQGVSDNTYKSRVSDYLVDQGWFETMNNSLTRSSYYNKLPNFDTNTFVRILNPLSAEFEVLRGEMIFNALEVVAFNYNRQNHDVRIFEFGKIYSKTGIAGSVTESYAESQKLSLCATGNYISQYWGDSEKEADFFYLKTMLSRIFQKIGLQKISMKPYSNDFLEGQVCVCESQEIARYGLVSSHISSFFEIEKPVFYAELNWDIILKIVTNEILFKAIPLFPEVHRDLSLLLDTSVTYEQIEQLAFETEKHLLKKVSIFDIYQGKGIPDGKKSYAVSFTIQSDTKTLVDKEIDAIMNKLIRVYSQKLNAELR